MPEEKVGEFPIPPLNEVDNFVKALQQALKESGLEIVAGGGRSNPMGKR